MDAENVGATGRSREIDDWVEHLNRLVVDVKAWAEASGWETRSAGRTMKEAGGVRYKVPILELKREEVWAALVPEVRVVTRADGLVQFRRMSDYEPAADLYLEEGRWTFRHAFRLRWLGDGQGSPAEVQRFLLDEASLDRVLGDIDAHV
jgi:hypothetical protein